ncbi:MULTISPECIES: type II secretion system secretin GspD [Ramlibacter]|uniref:Type II secretion system secretin GspD n=1 Tax=Ramlibacter pinisoli TaxID=2682844 RepID=A0A6N8IWJ5_9BURK|nr:MULTISPECIES: type II secretion system secretin GspD [Ramlibacter]MBA2965389.1 type II secretion system secretin GspD [Ramlibacter sp. CGMCC 1.13660]MVQ30353.1 type II secretion system secretin GspD [Ramlibacter pinisoli]
MTLRRSLVTLAAGLLVAGASGTHAQRASEPVTLNFANAEIEAVARTMAAITGRNIVVDPRVKGTISLSTERPVPPQQAFNQFVSTLRLSGFTVVDAAGLLKVVPEADAKLQGGTVSVGSPPGGAQIVTQIFRLNYETANNLVPILRPLISPNNTINVNPGNNSLVITDYADNLQRMGRIIAALDVSNATEVEVLPLKNALASDLAPMVQRLVEASGSPAAAAQGQADTSFRTTVLAEPRTNTLIVRASNAARMNLVRTLVDRLDQPRDVNPAGNIYVVYLKNAEATRLATTLRAAMAAMGTGTGALSVQGGTIPTAAAVQPQQIGGTLGSTLSGPATTAAQPTAQPSTGGQIQADPATNSLIITAPEPQYRQLRAVIDRLDARRAQVFVESLIAEVNADKAAEFGVQWQNIFGDSSSSRIGVLGTNFSVGGTNIISLQRGAADGTVAPSTGINLGIVKNINGTFYLGALARFLESNADGNILSTPNLLTLDNEEARIVIGQNVPFITGQFTNTGAAAGSVNPFQTIERKDVGLTLRVRPQISENGTVRMQIFQEVSSVLATSVNSPTGLITNKRSIESNVLVEDGAVVVLGGLLQDEYAGSVEKVPGLGDVPVFGNLFKSEARSRKKTNLMVFMRPVVVRDAAQTDELSLDRYDLMRLKQDSVQPRSSVVVPINEGPMLPVPGTRTTPGGSMPMSPTAPVPPAAPAPAVPAPAAPVAPAAPPAPAQTAPVR